MPAADRKYVKQNLKRCIGHVEDIHGYLQAVGTPFLEMGKTISEDVGQWPADYVRIIETIDIAIDMNSTLNDLLKALEESI